MGKAENAVQRACLEYLRLRGVFCWRSNNNATFDRTRGVFRAFSGMPGVPDIIGILPGGRFLGIECKAKKGKQSDSQMEFEAQCKRLGGVYLLVRDVMELARMMDGKA